MNISLGFLLHIHSSYNTYTIAPFFQASFGPCIVVNRKWLLKNWQYDVTCTLPAWCGLMYHKSPRDLTPHWVQLLLFPEIRSTSNYFYILSDLGSETSFCCTEKGDGNPTEIMLGPAGGMKVNCYLKIIYQQLQEWSTHRYD